MKRWMLLPFMAVCLWSGCSKKSGGVKLRTDTDSVAYVIGLNIGANLVKMDSTLNADAVCKGMLDYMSGRQLLSMEEAQTFYLRYVNYAVPEKIKGQERQYLDDVTADGSFRRSESGLRYDVRREGNAKKTISSDKERILLRCKVMRRDGGTAYGGAVRMWSPAALAYGSAGNDTLGVGANEPLYYEAELIDVQPDDRPDEKESDAKWKF